MTIKVCELGDLAAYEGRVVLLGEEQVALFYVPERGVFALQNWDPIGRANVLSRGIVGDVKGLLCVASPLYKQHFALESGVCLEQPSQAIRTWSVTLKCNEVWLEI